MSNPEIYKTNFAPGPCIHCGDHLAHDSWYGPEFGLCSYCARRFADIFSMAHSGEPYFLTPRTHPNPTRELGQKTKWRILRRDGFKCQSCGDETRPLHLDHIIPKAKGGTNDDRNLQALCDKCNIRKGARSPEEWGGRNG